LWAYTCQIEEGLAQASVDLEPREKAGFDWLHILDICELV
jgi:hypothetical protein